MYSKLKELYLSGNTHARMEGKDMNKPSYIASMVSKVITESIYTTTADLHEQFRNGEIEVEEYQIELSATFNAYRDVLRTIEELGILRDSRMERMMCYLRKLTNYH